MPLEKGQVPLEKGQNLHRAFSREGGCSTFSTKLSFDVRLESKHVRETARIISKVLKVSKETIRTRLRKQT